MKLVYIAGRYRAPTREGVNLNIQAAQHMGRLVVEMGHYPVIPHSNTIHFEHITDVDDQFYLDGTMEMLRRCDAVLLVPGWETSTGTAKEIEEACRINIPVFDSYYEIGAWLEEGEFREVQSDNRTGANDVGGMDQRREGSSQERQRVPEAFTATAEDS